MNWSRRISACSNNYPQKESFDERTTSPLPPFTRDSAVQKVRAAEDGWNSRDAQKVALAYTVDSEWRNRSEFVHGRGKSWRFCSENGVKSYNTG